MVVRRRSDPVAATLSVGTAGPGLLRLRTGARLPVPVVVLVVVKRRAVAVLRAAATAAVALPVVALVRSTVGPAVAVQALPAPAVRAARVSSLSVTGSHDGTLREG